MKPDIYISTIAFGGSAISNILDIATRHNWAIEFSSGLPFHADMQEVYVGTPVKRMAHNYFPAPADPFVLNLASSDAVTRRRSIEHCINGLRITRESGAPFFAAHAGFCIDPLPEELGKPIRYDNDFNRDEHWTLFIESVKEILQFAEMSGTRFLVENNVLAPFNFHNGANPLFCCESDDIARLFTDIPHPRLGLLLDTAHLKVSSTTLGLNAIGEVQRLKPYVQALHHSDNDGNADTNGPITETYWFLPCLKHFPGTVQVIEVKNLTTQEIHTHINLLQQYGAD